MPLQGNQGECALGYVFGQGAQAVSSDGGEAMSEYSFDVPDDVPYTVTLSIAPDEPKDACYNVHIYPWPHTIRVDGFASLQDAYWFAVQACHADPYARMPSDEFRRPPRPPKKETDGLPLFEAQP